MVVGLPGATLLMVLMDSHLHLTLSSTPLADKPIANKQQPD
jgi:hypothetical protein